MNFKYYIISDLKLIIECYIGEFNFEDIFECKKIEIKNPQWKESYNVLGDIRKGNITLTNQDIQKMYEYYKENQAINSKRKSAILTNSPDQVVFGTLISGYNKIKDSLVIPSVFSTLESSISWLGISRNELERINKILMQLSLDQ